MTEAFYIPYCKNVKKAADIWAVDFLSLSESWGLSGNSNSWCWNPVEVFLENGFVCPAFDHLRLQDRGEMAKLLHSFSQNGGSWCGGRRYPGIDFPGIKRN